MHEKDNGTFCDDRLSKGTWVEEEEEEAIVTRMGPVSWVAAHIRPHDHGQEAIANVDLDAFEDAIHLVSPYAELRTLHVMQISGRSWIQSGPHGGGDEFCTFTTTEVLPLEMLTPSP